MAIQTHCVDLKKAAWFEIYLSISCALMDNGHICAQNLNKMLLIKMSQRGSHGLMDRASYL